MEVRLTPEGDTGDGLRVMLRPNRTLSPRGMTALFAGLAIVVLAIGTGFVLLGAWPVLPFAGLELMLVATVVYRLRRHADDHERILVEGERITVIRRRGGREWRDEFPRYWTKVMLERRRGWYPSRLKLGSHGRLIVIGADVGEEEREALSAALGKALRKTD